MRLFLPILHQRCSQLLPDASADAVLLQKQILKIIFSLLQVSFQRIFSKMFQGAASNRCMFKHYQSAYFTTDNLLQFSLPKELLTKEIFTQWMEICRQVIERPVPDVSCGFCSECPELVLQFSENVRAIDFVS